MKGRWLVHNKFGNKRQSSPSPKVDKRPRTSPDETWGSLSLVDFEKAKKQKLCFLCLSNQHAKKYCPHLLSKQESTSKGKDKAMHTVQKLALDASPKYSAVEVLHDKEHHECCVIASMWQPTFGPHELHRIHGTINRQCICILVNNVETHNFLNYKFFKKLKLLEIPTMHKYVVEQIMGSDKEIWDTVVQGVELEVQGHMMTLDFQVMNMSHADVVLGREWLHGLGSTLKRNYEHNSLSFVSNGVHVLLLGVHQHLLFVALSSLI